MKHFFITTLLLLTASFAQAKSEKCYSLYMRENSDDPAHACVQFSPETGVANVINLIMINGDLKESLTLQAEEQIVAYKGHLALHYFTLNGEGRFHTVSGSHNVVTGGLTSLRVYSKIDGHLQQAVEFTYKPAPNQGCRPGRRCI